MEGGLNEREIIVVRCGVASVVLGADLTRGLEDMGNL